MIAMGMRPVDTATSTTIATTTKRPINDIDLPEDLPDFLRPQAETTKRPPRPINDIDLPQDMEHIHQVIDHDPALGHPEGQGSNGKTDYT